MTFSDKVAAWSAQLAVNLPFGLPGVEAAPLGDTFARHTVPVAEHVWLIYRTYSSAEAPFEGNVEVFEQSDGLVVVDAEGCPPSGVEVLEQTSKLSSKE